MDPSVDTNISNVLINTAFLFVEKKFDKFSRKAKEKGFLVVLAIVEHRFCQMDFAYRHRHRHRCCSSSSSHSSSLLFVIGGDLVRIIPRIFFSSASFIKSI